MIAVAMWRWQRIGVLERFDFGMPPVNAGTVSETPHGSQEASKPGVMDTQTSRGCCSLYAAWKHTKTVDRMNPSKAAVGLTPSAIRAVFTPLVENYFSGRR